MVYNDSKHYPRLKLENNKPDLSERFLKFAADVLRLIDQMPQTKSGKTVSDQLVRSATSVGANYEEARGADSKADFCHKLQIAYKEMRETRYWLCLADLSQLVVNNNLRSIIQEATELRAILAKAVATARGKSKSLLTF